MQVNGIKNSQTERIVSLTLEAHRASDEMLLTELFEVFSPQSIRSIMILGAHDCPDKIFHWTPDEEKM